MEAQPAESVDVFICYRRADRQWLDQITSALTSEGRVVASDLDIEHGARFGDAITQMIEASQIVLVLWTDNSIASDWVKNEAALAIEQDKYLGVMIEPVNLPVDLRYQQYLDLSREGPANALERIVAEIEKRLGASDVSETSAIERSGRATDDLGMFAVVQRIDYLEGYRTYINEFPNGVFHRNARARIDELSSWKRALKRRLPSLGALTLLLIALQVWVQYQASSWESAYLDAEARLKIVNAELAATQSTRNKEGDESDPATAGGVPSFNSRGRFSLENEFGFTLSTNVVKAVVIGSVSQGSQAEHYGILEGDVVVSVGDSAIKRPDEVYQAALDAKLREEEWIAVTLRQRGNLSIFMFKFSL